MQVTQILIMVVVLVVLVAGAFFAFQSFQQQPSTPLPVTQGEPESFGEELFQQSSNPGSKVPDTNPFDETETNPLRNVYRNPFGG